MGGSQYASVSDCLGHGGGLRHVALEEGWTLPVIIPCYIKRKPKEGQFKQKRNLSSTYWVGEERENLSLSFQVSIMVGKMGTACDASWLLSSYEKHPQLIWQSDIPKTVLMAKVLKSSAKV